VNIEKAFPSKYLKAADLDGKNHSAVIRDVVMEEMSQDDGEKPVLYFENSERGLVLNKTNANSVKEIHGPDTDDWRGKSVTLYTVKVQYGAKMVDGIRIQPVDPKDPKAGVPLVDPQSTGGDELPF